MGMANKPKIMGFEVAGSMNLLFVTHLFSIHDEKSYEIFYINFFKIFSWFPSL